MGERDSVYQAIKNKQRMQDIPYNKISDVLVFQQRLQCLRSVSIVLVLLCFIVRSPVHYSSSKAKRLVNISFSCVSTQSLPIFFLLYG
jgi:hypothetical protein